MRVSFGTYVASDNINGKNGYGAATLGMLKSLQELGYHVEDNDSSADVEIWFSQPQNWKFSKGPYKIGYHPWESTQLLPGWAEIMNQCDEIWTPSPIVAEWYKTKSGITVPVHVYEHGLDPEWTPVKREPDHTIKFLHVGAEASRKGGWDVVRQFRKAFPNRKDVSLTIKMVHSNWNGIPQLGRTRYINRNFNKHQLVQLFHYHDAYVYPSYGEGFGLTPLQALGTGMPTITLPAWAPYADFIDPRLAVGSKMVTSPWPDIHPGEMFRPNSADTIEAMRFVADNYDEVRDYACAQAREVHEKYDWNTLTKEAFEGLEKRLNS